MERLDAKMLLDADTTLLVIRLAKAWGVTELEAIKLAIRLANLKIDEAIEPAAALSEIKNDQIFEPWHQGSSLNEVAAEVEGALKPMGQILKDVQNQTGQPAARTGATARVKALKKLQRSLQLTPADAAQWQKDIHQARR